MTRKKEPSKPRPAKEPKVRTFETFQKIVAYDIDRLRQDEPSCFNGWVRVKRYRVTIEEIEEPLEVIQARIQELWDKHDNHHHTAPLREVGRAYGMDLVRRF